MGVGVGGGGVFKALLQLANFTLGPDATLNTEIHKISVRIKAPNSVNASKRKNKNQINHYNPKNWDIQTFANSADPDRNLWYLIRVYTICHACSSI